MKKILTLFVLLSILSPQTSFAFDDVPPQSPYYSAVESLANRGIVTRDRGNFLLSRTLTRAELAKVSLLAAGIEVEIATETPFPDLTADWMKDILFTAKKHGIIEGYTDGKFRPNSEVTYIEALKIMGEALDENIGAPSRDLYDDSKTTDWWTKYIERAYERNLLSIKSGNTFEIHRPFTRNMMAQMLYRDLLIEENMANVFSSSLEEEENSFQDLNELDDTLDFDIDMDFNLN